MSDDKNPKGMTKKEINVINTKEDLLRDFVNTKFKEAYDYWNPIQEEWRQIKANYKQAYTTEEDELKTNISLPYLKKIIRNKCSHYMDILLSRGAESFDLEPGEEEDEKNAELLQGKIVFDLNKAEVEKKLRPWIWNYENYGYGVVYIPGTGKGKAESRERRKTATNTKMLSNSTARISRIVMFLIYSLIHTARIYQAGRYSRKIMSRLTI